MERKVFELKKIINKDSERLKTSKSKKPQSSSSKIVTSKAFQRVKNETLLESHLKFGTTDEAQNFTNSKK